MALPPRRPPATARDSAAGGRRVLRRQRCGDVLDGGAGVPHRAAPRSRPAGSDAAVRPSHRCSTSRPRSGHPSGDVVDGACLHGPGQCRAHRSDHQAGQRRYAARAEALRLCQGGALPGRVAGRGWRALRLRGLCDPAQRIGPWVRRRASGGTTRNRDAVGRGTAPVRAPTGPPPVAHGASCTSSPDVGLRFGVGRRAGR